MVKAQSYRDIYSGGVWNNRDDSSALADDDVGGTLLRTGVRRRLRLVTRP